MPHAYILRCSDGSFYTGSTWDLERRIAEHNLGVGANYTRKRRPVALAWCDYTERIEDAYVWEKTIQGWSHAKKQLLIDGGIDLVAGWSARERGKRESES